MAFKVEGEARVAYMNEPGVLPVNPPDNGELKVQQADALLVSRKADGTTRFTDLRPMAEQLAGGPLALALGNRQSTFYTPELGPGIAGTPRTVEEALDAGYIDARALGFRSSLDVGDAAALAANNAAAAVLNSKLSEVGGTVFFSRGVWPISQSIEILDKHFGALGEGEGRTILRFDGTGNLFNVTVSSLFYRLDFRGFTAWANSAGAGIAIKIVRPTGLSSTESGPNIRNIEFVPSDRTKYQWQTAIDVIGGWNINITENLCVGRSGAFSSDFIVLRDRSTPATIVNNKAFGVNRAVYMPPGGFSEGPIIIANQFVGVNYGVYLDDGTNAPGAQIVSNHINAYKACIVSIARPQVMISKNLLYRYGDPGSGFDWNGVYLGTASSDATLEDNSFYGYRGQYPGSAVAVTGVQSTAGSVFGGMFADCDFGIIGSQTWAMVYDKIKIRNVGTPQYQLGAGSYHGNFFPF